MVENKNLKRNATTSQRSLAPYTPQDLWKILHQLIVKYHGQQILPEAVESAFNIELTLHRFADNSGYSHTSTSDGAWYSFIGIIDSTDRRTNRFALDWIPTALAGGACLTNDIVRKDMMSTDWNLTAEMNSYGTQRDEYSKESAFLYIELKGKCVAGVSFGRMSD